MVDIESRMDEFGGIEYGGENIRDFIRQLVKDVRAEHDVKDKELLDVVNSTLNRDFRALPHGYKKTLELFSIEEIRKALENLKKDEWHSDKYQTLKLDYLLRATTIDKFRQIDKPEFRQRLNIETNKMETF